MLDYNGVKGWRSRHDHPELSKSCLTFIRDQIGGILPHNTPCCRSTRRKKSLIQKIKYINFNNLINISTMDLSIN